MTIEEKAEAYDEAKARMSKAYNDNRCSLYFMNEIFHEFKESEDERMRNTLIEYFNAYPKDYYGELKKSDILSFLKKQKPINYTDDDMRLTIIQFLEYASSYGCPDILSKEKAKTWIAWLERQDESDETKAKTFLINKGYPIDTNSVFPTYEEMYNIIREGLEKQSKPIDKIEPKFKIGEWIVKNDGKDCFSDGSYALQIIDNACNSYKLSNGRCLIDPFNTYRLWTIQDAKDGDVLVEDSCIFIIQKLGDNSTAAKTYCTLYNDGDFDDGSILYFDIDSTKPATKEQRDLLFRKMKEAGYKWDAEKKELKKIEQVNVNWSREDEQNLNACLGYISDDSLCRWLKDVIHVKYDKTAWSEEDENRFRNLIYLVEHSNEGKGTKEGFVKFINRLKERYTWKPSDEQMKQLKSAADIYPDSRLGLGLKSLYQDLKKLMEE